MWGILYIWHLKRVKLPYKEHALLFVTITFTPCRSVEYKNLDAIIYVRAVNGRDRIINIGK